MAVIVINPYQYAAPIGPSADPYSDYVSLLLHGNGTNGSTTFTDSSSYNHTVTANGDAKISTTQSKFGGASMYFDGSGDYLSVPDDTSLHLGSDDFTFEFWTYLNSTNGHFINKRVSTSANVQYLYFTISGGTLYLYATSNGSSWNIASNFNFGNTTLSTGQWYHIALVRNGTEIATYVNGIKSPNTITTSAAIHNGSTNSLRIAGDVPYNNYLNGYIDDFRITKGVARYTGNFNPPTAELPDPSDPDFDSVSLLLHGDGTNGSTTFIDSSSSQLVLQSQNSTNAYISTTESVFGGSSLYFSGGAGGFLKSDANSGFWFGTGDFTIEAFVRRISHGNLYQTIASVLSDYGAAGNPVGYGWSLFLTTDFKFGCSIYTNNSIQNRIRLTSPTAVQVGVWYHVAAVKNGTSFVLYVDGGSVSTSTVPSDFNIAPNPLTLLNIGSYGNRAYPNSFGGYIDDLRITKGVARYTSNFTPPTAPLPDETPPIVTDGLVLHLDAGDSASYPGSGTTWTNLAGNGNNGTLVNGVGYDSANGGSLTFDGTNDYVSIPNMSTYLTNKTQFSYSTFIKITGSGSFAGMFFTFGNSNNFENDMTFYYKAADTTLKFQVNNGSDGNGSVPYTIGQYDNICVVYDGNQSTNATRLKVYINGNLQTLTFNYTVPASTSSTAFTDCVIGIYSTANYANTSLFAGNLGTAQLYNKALTQSEVTQNFDALKKRYGL